MDGKWARPVMGCEKWAGPVTFHWTESYTLAIQCGVVLLFTINVVRTPVCSRDAFTCVLPLSLQTPSTVEVGTDHS